jgi:hypothetical protein
MAFSPNRTHENNFLLAFNARHNLLKLSKAIFQSEFMPLFDAYQIVKVQLILKLESMFDI